MREGEEWGQIEESRRGERERRRKEEEKEREREEEEEEKKKIREVRPWEGLFWGSLREPLINKFSLR